MVNDYLNVFLSDKYINYQVLGQNLSENELQLQKIAKIQRNIQESCLLRASMIGLGSGVLGSLVGTFLYSINMSNTSVEPEVSVKKEFIKQYKNFVPYVKSTIKSFAKLGFLYSLFECLINKSSGNNDINNVIYAGCTTGAFLGLKNGPFATVGGCIGFATFSFLMESYQRNKHSNTSY
ncbi:Tim17/Tim22/Tim23/Pmp24 family protein [Theileria parva strain Muguga]|uniref:Tim17/Tim22/Tim23/Pmp24 family protein n=1 Tax=Theileria parva strain Muguga TaxID=333668 RepID=UPI001C61FFD1|nr:Tim17/Tim22/Tim23/Pmp24 family protein [Theileria parva strain Muguga]KAF5153138.1 Tim17/Tim22/Tim23/Pmp24 family protein [Theileria parva strain Muguga]